jgi:hypothetical protein
MPYVILYVTLNSETAYHRIACGPFKDRDNTVDESAAFIIKLAPRIRQLGSDVTFTIAIVNRIYRIPKKNVFSHADDAVKAIKDRAEYVRSRATN